MTINNNNLQISSKIIISSTEFINCEAKLGGAIYIQGNIVGNITNSLFESNKAIDSLNQEGIGSGIYYYNDNFNNFENKISNNNLNLFNLQILKNYASNFGSGIISTKRLCYIDFNTINLLDNYSPKLYGYNYGSYSTKIVILHEDKNYRAMSLNEIQQEIKKNLQTTNVSITIGSSISKNITLALLDYYNNLNFVDNYTTAKFDSKNPSKNGDYPTVNTRIVKSVQGLITFQDFKVIVSPENEFTLELSVIFQEGQYPNISFTSNFKKTVNFFSRKCLIGEIRLIDNSCYRCPMNFYSIIDPMKIAKQNQNCNRCPNTAICSGNEIKTKPGYWKYPESSMVLKCEDEKACKGTVDNSEEDQCFEGYSGIMCHECTKGYQKIRDGTCQSCKSSIETSILSFFSFLIIFLYLIYQTVFYLNPSQLTCRHLMKSFILKIFVNYLQHASLLYIIALKWGPHISGMFEIQTNFAGFGFSAMSFGCVNKTSLNTFYFETIFNFFFPLIYFIINLLLLFLIILSTNLHNYSTLLKYIAVLNFVITFYIFYPKLIETTLNLINCRKIAELNNKTIDALSNNLNIICWDSQHNIWASIGIIFFSIIGILIPIIIFFIMKRNKETISNFIEEDINKSIMKSSSPRNRNKSLFNNEENTLFEVLKKKFENRNSQDITISEGFVFFYSPFTSQCYYWEIIIFFRKAFLVLIGILTKNSLLEVKFLILSLYFIIFYKLNSSKKPYNTEIFNDLESYSFIILVVTCIMGVFLTVESTESYSFVFVIVVYVGNILFIVLLIILFILLFIEKKKIEKLGIKYLLKLKLKLELE